jgi:crotonobetainyl-CoA:carnitine CoA-transferase CaiB-like acyl-CoA transferase
MDITTRFLAAAPLAASLLLVAACNSEPETITAERPDPQAVELKNAAPVRLPPAIAASRTYRCKDNSLIYVDFFNDQKTANFRTDRAAAPTVLTAAEPGQPYTAEGYSVSANAANVSVTAPGKGTQSCKA